MLQLPERMREPTLDSMNFLNEVVERYPKAISFAPGRPASELFGVARSLDLLRKHAPAILGRGDIGSEAGLDEIAQYGRTNGIVHRHVARQLLQDEGLELDPDRLVITNGCQEAMLLLLLTLFTPGRDVLLSTEPVYLGITAAARLLGIEVDPVRLRPHGPDLEELSAAMERLRREGKVARALYTIPDFDNPSGYTTSLARRQRLCALARRNNLLLFEDMPYRMLRYERAPLPLLKAIDPEQVVLLGSYSKTVFPGLRIGFLSGDVKVSLAGRVVPLSEAVAKAKSLTSVNTSPLMQATLAAILIENGHSLASHAAMLSAHYREKRDALLAAMERYFSQDVRWNRPEGGFFVTVRVPFEFTMSLAEECAASADVIVAPMSLFAFATPYHHAIRLSFSAVALDDIDEGIARLATFVRERQARPLDGVGTNPYEVASIQPRMDDHVGQGCLELVPLPPSECPMINDANHPRNFCYQCREPLPPDCRDKPWNISSRDHHPMFDSKQCRDAAIRRHLHAAFEFTNLTNYLDDVEGTRALKQRDGATDPGAGGQHDHYAEAEALRDLAEEYRRFEKRYEQSPVFRGPPSTGSRTTDPAPEVAVFAPAGG
jgi:(S)-3,5-dihydroxyphenylglycine transaminase